MKTYIENDIYNICQSKGVLYLSGYKTTNDPINVLCHCGNKYSIHLHNISKTCKQCTTGRKYSQEVIEEELELYGLTLISKYQGNRIPMTYICECGGIGRAKLCHIRNGNKCGHCDEMRIINKFEELGYKVLVYNKALAVTYLCTCGNIETINASNFFKNKLGCSKCKTHWNYQPNKIKTKRQDLHLWKKAVLGRDNFECQRCSSDDYLHVHHIEAFSTNPELIDDVDNGIVLCDICHRGLHSKYGHNVGRENLDRELRSYT